MRPPYFALPTVLLGGIAVAGLAGGILIPVITGSHDRQRANNNNLCRAQFNAAKAAGAKLPNIDVATLRYKFLPELRRAQCGTADGTFTWDPTNNALTLYGPR